jgi:hypothetical protein
MKRTFIAMLLAGLAAGCGTSNLTWEISDVTYGASDECEFSAGDPISGNFLMTISGETVTMEHESLIGVGGSTTDYLETDDVVTLEGTFQNTDVPPCVVKYDDTFKRLDTNDTLTVKWTHVENDDSSSGTACRDSDPPLWDVDLPCTTIVNFTLTKVE